MKFRELFNKNASFINGHYHWAAENFGESYPVAAFPLNVLTAAVPVGLVGGTIIAAAANEPYVADIAIMTLVAAAPATIWTLLDAVSLGHYTFLKIAGTVLDNVVAVAATTLQIDLDDVSRKGAEKFLKSVDNEDKLEYDTDQLRAELIAQNKQYALNNEEAAKLRDPIQHQIVAIEQDLESIKDSKNWRDEFLTKAGNDVLAEKRKALAQLENTIQYREKFIASTEASLPTLAETQREAFIRHHQVRSPLKVLVMGFKAA